MQTVDRLIAFERWANQRITEAVLSLPPDRREQPARLLAHIASAMRVWHDRIAQIDAPAQVWRELSAEESAAEIATVTDLLAGMVRLKARQLGQTIAYRNTQGVAFDTPLVDILQHIAFHSHYHRGQINAAIRQAGGTPAGVDYITFVRESPK